MDVRIGVIQNPKELSIELAADAKPDDVKGQVDAALSGKETVLWLVDRTGRSVAVPVERIAYVEISAADGSRRVGFGG